MVLIVLTLLVGFSAKVYSQVPFPCDDSFYQVFNESGQLITFDLENNTFVFAPNNAGRIINAFGYRIEDDLGYGVFTDDNSLGQIDAVGTVVDLGPSDGLLYVIRNEEFNKVYAINVDTVSVENVINIEGLNFFISDMAFNPIDGLFYGVTQLTEVIGTEVPPALLITIDVVAGRFEIVGPTGLSTVVVFGSMYADGSGNVFGSERVGEPIFYQLDTESGLATALGETVGESPIDGFFCSLNPGAFPSRSVPTLSIWGLIFTSILFAIFSISYLGLQRKKQGVN